MALMYRGVFGFALVAGFIGMSVPAAAQTPPFTCLSSAGVAPIVRATGLTEPVGDFFLTCTGGTPTPAGLPVPQVDFTLILNTNLTSKITAATASGTFSEALLLVDEPNSQSNPTRAFLNCGQTGAPDNGVSGPDVCGIISTGNPTQSYDGSTNTNGTVACDGVSGTIPLAPNSYGCGRPNAYQGRMGTPSSASVLNAVTFLGVPLDPPGPGATRYIRITNIRANAASIGLSTPVPNQVLANISTVGDTSLAISNPQQTVGYVVAGLSNTGCTAPAASTVRVCEGFASSFKTKNVSFWVGDHSPLAGNASYSPTSYTYNGNTNYPVDDAQNVPGVFYNTESFFEWQNTTTNGPPTTNPPPGFGAAVTVANNGSPLGSGGYALVATDINGDGISTAGTRVALRFTNVPAGATIQVPTTIDLNRITCASSCIASGVMTLTTADSAGGGIYSRAATTTLGANNVAVYEVLFADPYSIEYGDIPYTLTHGGSHPNVQVTASLAPFYSSSSAGQASATGFLPRFVDPATVEVGDVENLINAIAAPGLSAGTIGLDIKLLTIVADLATNNTASACSNLTSLIGTAQAESGKQLTVAQANAMVAAAMQLQAQLGCQ